MEIYISGDAKEIKEFLLIDKSKELAIDYLGSEKKTPSPPTPVVTETDNKEISVGRPSSISRTTDYIKDHPAEEYSLPEMSDAIGLSTETLRNHMIQLKYYYDQDSRSWRKKVRW